MTMARRLPGRKLKKVTCKVNQREYALELRVVDTSDRYSSSVDLTYRIITNDPCPIDVQDDDPNECVKKAQAIIQDQLAIEWRDVLHVSIDCESRHTREVDANTRQHGFDLKWDRKQIGMRGKEPVYRNNQHSHIYAGELETGRSSSRFHGEESIQSVIDDTEENRAALDAIGSMLDQLQKRLGELLTPAAIGKTLTDVRSKLPALLAAPLANTPKGKGRRG